MKAVFCPCFLVSITILHEQCATTQSCIMYGSHSSLRRETYSARSRATVCDVAVTDIIIQKGGH